MTKETSVASFLRRLLKRQPSRPPHSEAPQAFPLGLNRDQVEAVVKLASTPQYNSYTAALQAVSEKEFAQLLSGLPHDQYLLLCGRIQARLEVLSLPETLELKLRELDEHRRTPDTPDRSRHDLALVGSPYWSPGKPVGK